MELVSPVCVNHCVCHDLLITPQAFIRNDKSKRWVVIFNTVLTAMCGQVKGTYHDLPYAIWWFMVLPWHYKHFQNANRV